MILLTKGILLHVPKHIGKILGPFREVSSPPEKGCPVLVVREPISWLLAYYLGENTPLSFKDWYQSYSPPLQTSLSSTKTIIRSEYFVKDIKEIGVEATIKLSVLPITNVCSGTRLKIMNKYKEDYLAGDYLDEF